MITNRDDIKNWLEQHAIKNYTISEEGFVSCQSSVNLGGHGLIEIPVQFSYVHMTFDCSMNKLTSLKGSPLEVGTAFYCTQNQLQTLEGGPQTIGTSYHCSGNLLTSLYGAPTKIPTFFHANTNQLKTLEFCPQSVRTMNVTDNPIETLKWYPLELEKKLRISHETVRIAGLESFYDEDGELKLTAELIHTIKLNEKLSNILDIGREQKRKKI